MKRTMLLVAAAVNSFCLSATLAQFSPYHAEQPAPVKKSSSVHLVKGPEVELVRSTWAVIRWTSTNPRGADEHFAVAHYGMEPKDMTRTAKSHIRLNREHSTTVFRVMISDLKPNTTYYYTVASMGGDGTVDPLQSPKLHFTTRP